MESQNRSGALNREKAKELFAATSKTISDISDELIQNLFEKSNLVHFEQGELFQRAGEFPKYLGFNLNGLFRLYYIDNEGHDLTKGFSDRGSFVVSYSALVQKRPSHFFIEALVDTDILQFDWSELMEMLENDLRWYPFVFKLVENVYIVKEMRERSFLIDDATTRYLNCKREYPNLESKVKQYHIASFIGITPQALSRIRKKLKLT
ncbi:cyclic nucleotide-binding protein [Prosthecochloris marina]|uniref:Cyclic nucleotide-binding protein n=1 Tax=Prosthecochloris marina TaxID=2017681 RepID=A0A317T797_9CHLB|nr:MULTISPECIES: Crp/Fnr family transcriptional regulator [Prosthecochloris]PWW81637.1 cyclic nucleotide-binding protein [Prosthecochloris marina]